MKKGYILLTINNAGGYTKPCFLFDANTELTKGSAEFLVQRTLAGQTLAGACSMVIVAYARHDQTTQYCLAANECPPQQVIDALIATAVGALRNHLEARSG